MASESQEPQIFPVSEFPPHYLPANVTARTAFSFRVP